MFLACRTVERGQKILAQCRADADETGHSESHIEVVILGEDSVCTKAYVGFCYNRML